MGPHIKTRSWRCFSATQLLEPHKKASHAGLRLAAAWWKDGVLEKHSTDARTGSFLGFFYLNGVKHLHKWEAPATHWSDQKKKSCLFPPPNFLSKEKKNSIHFWNLFCTFCEISSETWTEDKWGLVLHKIPTCSTRPLRNKESHERPTLPDLLNTLKIHFAFFFVSITFIKVSIGL